MPVLLLLLLPVLAAALECPQDKVAVPDPRTQEVACKPRLKRTREIFDQDKHPQDPCPDGTWWHRTREDCTPVVCTEESNTASLGPLCAKGQHEHLNTGADWTRPIVCVENYKPGNETTGGKNPKKNGCDLCVINKPEHRMDGGRAWRFEKPGEEERKKKRSGSQSGKLDGKRWGGKSARFKAPRIPGGAPKKGDSCPEGEIGAQRADGRLFCLGGESAGHCPPGAEDFKGTCVPCLAGEQSVVIDGLSRCLSNPCPQGRLPVPEKGLVERYVCPKPAPVITYASGPMGIPMPQLSEPRVDRARILPEEGKTPAEAPACAKGEGLRWTRSEWDCRPCSAGLEALPRNGHPVCLPKRKACPEGRVPDASRCAACPKGSVFSASRGPLFPRCLPEEALPTKAPEALRKAETDKAAPEQAPAVPLLR